VTQGEIYYEMLWDCSQCNTRGLLGDSHRHCPTCGCAQDAAKRYFPKSGEEIEAKNHEFVGTDWRCAYCSSPNSAAAAHCTNCGAGKDGTKPVAIIADTAATPVIVEPMPVPNVRSRGWMRWVLGLLALAVMGILFLFTSTKETTATVAQRNWTREIQIEQMTRVPETAWCDSIPSDAYAITRSREQRTTRSVEDGQTCHDERIDKGDGTFVKRRECTPRFREEPVYDNLCRFHVNRWRVARTVKADTTNTPMPVWPAVGRLNANALGSGAGALGTEREGPRHEHYELTLTSEKKSWKCDVSEAVWTQYPVGASTPLKVRLTGGADCASLK
jgi:hypothetical protein